MLFNRFGLILSIAGLAVLAWGGWLYWSGRQDGEAREVARRKEATVRMERKVIDAYREVEETAPPRDASRTTKYRYLETYAVDRSN